MYRVSTSILHHFCYYCNFMLAIFFSLSLFTISNSPSPSSFIKAKMAHKIFSFLYSVPTTTPPPFTLLLELFPLLTAEAPFLVVVGTVVAFF